MSIWKQTYHSNIRRFFLFFQFWKIYTNNEQAFKITEKFQKFHPPLHYNLINIVSFYFLCFLMAYIYISISMPWFYASEIMYNIHHFCTSRDFVFISFLLCSAEVFDSVVTLPWIWPQPYILLGFPGVSVGKESAYNVRELGSIPVLGRCPGEGKGHTLQYSCLENS